MNKKFKLSFGLSILSLIGISASSCSLIYDALDVVDTLLSEQGYEIKYDDVVTNQPLVYEDKSNEVVSTKWDYEYVNAKGNYMPVTPSTGDVNILVIPVQLNSKSLFGTTEKFSSTRLNNIEAAFNGNKEDGTTSYWESVSSFYKKSSYGKLNLHFDVLDPYSSVMSKSEFEAKVDDKGSETIALLDEIYSFRHALTKDGEEIDITDSTRYDKNNDGYIDGVWLIYNVFDQREVVGSGEKTKYWAYTTNYFGNEDSEFIKFGKYANFAYSFLTLGSPLGYDTHTAIHETGHMFGLDDYYSYDLDANYYGHMGGVDMMDNNVGDHSAFSKFSLGWVSPEVVYEKECEITLNAFEESGDCVILPANYFNNSAFSEYLILEYYTPTGLNYLDYRTVYRGTYPRMFTDSGILIYHVDARVAQFGVSVKNPDELIFKNYADKNASEIHEPTNQFPYYSFVANSNTPSMNYLNKTFSLVNMISASGRQLYGSSKYANNNDLFQVGDKFNKRLARVNFSDDSFFDGTSLSYEVEVTSLSDKNATIKIRR